MDIKWILSAQDNASSVFEKVGLAGKQTAAGINGAFDGLMGTFGKVSGTLGALGAGAMVGFMKERIDLADEIGKMAQKIGVTVEELSALQYAGKLADVSTEQLGIGMKQLAKNLVEAASGSKEQVAAFNALGIEVKNNDGTFKSSNQVFLEVADRFSQMEDGAAKTAISMKLFGKSGYDLIPLLNEGADGFERNRKEAERLGLILDEKTTKSAERFNDNLTRLKSAAEGAGFALTDYILPPLVRISEEMVKISQQGSWFDKLAALEKNAAKIGWDIMKGGPVNAPAMLGMRLFDNGTGGKTGMTTYPKPSRAEVKSPPSSALQDYLNPSAKVGSSGARSSLKTVKDDYFSAWGEIQKFSKKVADSMSADQKELEEAQKKVTEGYQYRSDEISKYAAAAGAWLQEEIDMENEHLAVLNEINAVLYDRSAYGGAMNAITQYMDETANMGAQIEQSLGDNMRNMEDAIVQFTMSGKMNWRSMVEFMMADIARMAVAKPITSALGGLLGTGLSALFGMFTSGSSSFGSAATFGSGYTNPNPYPVTYSLATGTNYVPSDGLAMLHKGEAVIPAAYNGGTPNITVNIRNESGKKVEAEQENVKFDYKNLVLDIVLKEAKSSPSFRQAMATR